MEHLDFVRLVNLFNAIQDFMDNYNGPCTDDLIELGQPLYNEVRHQIRKVTINID